MKLIRVFPRRTKLTPDDDMAFVGVPPMMTDKGKLPEADEVHVSCTFTWDKPRAEYLAKAWGQYYPVKLGGPAYGSPISEFVPGRYIKHGVTFTTIGCNNNCPPCLVRGREGALQERNPFADGYIIQDNNFLQSSRDHRFRVYEMLNRQSRAAVFSGGLQASLVTPEVADEFRPLRIKAVFLACDQDWQREHLKRAAELLSFLGRNKLYCYTLIGEHGTNFADLLHDVRRLHFVYKAGCLPYAQLYQPADKWIKYPNIWKELSRDWIRPAIMKSIMKASVTGQDATVIRVEER